eukprot:scaffold1834_cov89-Isochrysis_galbana.AAC.1
MIGSAWSVYTGGRGGPHLGHVDVVAISGGAEGSRLLEIGLAVVPLGVKQGEGPGARGSGPEATPPPRPGPSSAAVPRMKVERSQGGSASRERERGWRTWPDEGMGWDG